MHCLEKCCFPKALEGAGPPVSGGSYLRSNLDIVLSPHRTQFHLAPCLARSKHGCDLNTVPNRFKFGDERSVGKQSKLNRAFTVPHAQVYRAKFWHSA